MAMRWTERDDSGTDFLLRSGTGVVASVEGVNLLPGTTDQYERFRAAIQVDPPSDQAVVQGYTIWPTIEASNQSLLDLVIDACVNNTPIHWTVEWRRHDNVPTDIPIGALDFSFDVWSRIRSISPIEKTATV